MRIDPRKLTAAAFLIIGIAVSYFGIYGLTNSWQSDWIWVLTQGVILTNMSYSILVSDNIKKTLRLWLLLTACSVLILYRGQ